MTSRLAVRAVARRELDLAIDWYGARRVGLAERFVGAVDAALEQASRSPGRFPVAVGDLRSARVAGFPYRIYFRLSRDKVVVVAVFHVRRDSAPLARR